MKIFLGVVLYFAAYGINKWYGYERGKKDPRFWRPIHAYVLPTIIINLLCIGLFTLGIYIMFFI